MRKVVMLSLLALVLLLPASGLTVKDLPQEECSSVACNSTGCVCLDENSGQIANESPEAYEEPACALQSVYFTYNGNVTKELYVGGHLHFPRAIADRIKVTGGVVEKEDQTGWKIRVTQSVVNVQYVKLSGSDFSYSTRTFKAKEYPAELYRPVTPDEMRLKLVELSGKLEEFERELRGIKTDVKAAAEKPTAGEQLMGFLLYFPPMWVVYAAIGVMALLSLLGWWYARD